MTRTDALIHLAAVASSMYDHDAGSQPMTISWAADRALILMESLERRAADQGQPLHFDPEPIPYRLHPQEPHCGPLDAIATAVNTLVTRVGGIETTLAEQGQPASLPEGDEAGEPWVVIRGQLSGWKIWGGPISSLLTMYAQCGPDIVMTDDEGIAIHVFRDGEG